jgi:hypothetical protein
MATWEPQVGDDAIELRHSGKVHEADRVSVPVTVQRVTATMVVTSDGERYSRATLKPISEGRYSARTLVPVTDDRVLCVRGREALAELARLTDNLARLDRANPIDFMGAFAQIQGAAEAARKAHVKAMLNATRAAQEAKR